MPGLKDVLRTLVRAGAGTLMGACAVTREPPSAPPPAEPGAPVARILDLTLHGDPTRVVLPPGHGPGWRGPALVFFHGHGMDEQQLTSRTGLAEGASRAGWVAASGLLGNRRHWSNEAALRAAGRLLEALPARWGVDPAQVFLVGFSMGGGTALIVAANPLRMPYRVAAVASSQGVVDPTTLAPPYQQTVRQAHGLARGALVLPALSQPMAHVEALRGLPVYLEHGEADEVVPFGQSLAVAERLEALGSPAALTLHPGRRHGESAMDEAAILRFLQQRGSPGP